MVDVAIVVLSLPVVWKLQLQRTKRLKIMGIFAVGVMYVRNVTDFCDYAADELTMNSVSVSSILLA